MKSECLAIKEKRFASYLLLVLLLNKKPKCANSMIFVCVCVCVCIYIYIYIYIYICVCVFSEENYHFIVMHSLSFLELL